MNAKRKKRIQYPESKRAWRIKNRDRIAKQRRVNYLKNIEANRQKNRNYVSKNRERIANYRKEYSNSHKNEKREYDRIRRQNLDENKKQAYRIYKQRWKNKNADYYRQWNSKNADKLRQYRKNWASKNKASVKAKTRRYFSKRSDFAEPNKVVVGFYEAVRKKSKVTCYYCGRVLSGKKCHIDHVIAVSKNGEHAISNLCVSCPSCNYSKSNKAPSEVFFNDQKFLNF